MQALNRMATLILPSLPFNGDRPPPHLHPLSLSLPPSAFYCWAGFVFIFRDSLDVAPPPPHPPFLSGKCWDKRIMSLWREAAANGDVSEVTSGNKPSRRGWEGERVRVSVPSRKTRTDPSHFHFADISVCAADIYGNCFYWFCSDCRKNTSK